MPNQESGNQDSLSTQNDDSNKSSPMLSYESRNQYQPTTPDDDGVSTLVIDNGSGVIKAGFAGDDAPRSAIPTIIGRPKHQVVCIRTSQNNTRMNAILTPLFNQ